jgi:hypothetical protein
MKHRTLVRTATAIASVALGLGAPAALHAQDGDGPAVGAVAPDFTVRPVTKDGAAAAPMTLSAMKGRRS